jgi:hypothetical protein
LHNEVRNGRREGRSDNQHYDSSSSPRRPETRELNEEVCHVHHAIRDIREDCPLSPSYRPSVLPLSPTFAFGYGRQAASL